MRYFIATLLIFFIAGCAASSYDGGQLINSFNASDIKNKLEGDGAKASIYSGVKVYKIFYDTKDINNKDIKASGVIIVPNKDDLINNQNREDVELYLNKLHADGMGVVIYNHGTIVSNSDAPSNLASKDSFRADPRGAYSYYGAFITLIPDYIGFGSSKDSIHPYMIKSANARTILDFYKASIKFINSNNIAKINNKLYITGYSEGGYTTLASLKAFEDSGIEVTMAIPMAGPYRLDSFANIFKENRDFNTHTYGVAETIFAYSKVYNFDIKSAINDKYIDVVNDIFTNKKYSYKEVEDILPKKLTGENGLLKDSFVANFKDSNFYLKLKENSINDSFITPIKLLHCKGDDMVPYQIAQEQRDILSENGSSVELIELQSKFKVNKNLTHTKCFYPASIESFSLIAKDNK